MLAKKGNHKGCPHFQTLSWLSALRSFESLSNIGNNIVAMLQPDGKPYEIGRHAGGLLFLLRQLLVSS